jgi:hypothetical protein
VVLVCGKSTMSNGFIMYHTCGLTSFSFLNLKRSLQNYKIECGQFFDVTVCQTIQYVDLSHHEVRVFKIGINFVQ